MAEIVQSLFGVSPEMYQRQQQDRVDAQALRFAQLDPFQQANYAIGRGANMLGGAIGGALGGQDPELQRITMRQQIASQLNPGDPASIQQAIAALSQAGDAEGAMMLQGEYRKLQESGALIDQRTAAAQASLAQATREREPRAAPTTNDLTNARAIAALAGPEGSPEYDAAFRAEYQRLTAPKEGADPIQKLILTGNYTPASVELYQRTKNVADLKPVDKRAVTNINVSNTAENEYAKVAGKSTAERDINLIENAQSVATTLPKMYETRQLLESGDLNTGIGAEIQQVIDRTRSKFLNDKRAGRVVNDTEYLNALLGSDVFPQISALGIGARGLDTPAEREFLREVITGTISMDRNTLKRMTDFRIRSAERAVEKYNEQLGAGEFKQYQAVTGRTLNPIRTRTPAARQGDGTPQNPIRLD
jgi:hypothetical protein